MRDYTQYEIVRPSESSFPLIVHYPEPTDGFPSHWHEYLEIHYCISGRGIIECDSVPIETQSGDLIVINSNQLHSGTCMEKPFSYYCLLIDPSLMKGSFDISCEQKYIHPIAKNLILFENKVAGNPMIAECIDTIAKEYSRKELGYELAVKSSLYRLFVLLLRSHMQKVLTQKEYNVRLRNVERLDKVLDYIERNYAEDISIEQLSGITHLSRDHFSHLFKSLTGKSPSEYINSLRMDKAELLLKNTGLSITEIAMLTGFDDINYFSRTFRKYKKTSPSALRKSS